MQDAGIVSAPRQTVFEKVDPGTSDDDAFYQTSDALALLTAKRMLESPGGIITKFYNEDQSKWTTEML